MRPRFMTALLILSTLAAACVTTPQPLPGGGVNPPPVQPTDAPTDEPFGNGYPEPEPTATFEGGYPPPEATIDTGGYPPPIGGDGYPAPDTCAVEGPEVQRREFSAGDGVLIAADFYPAGDCGAPVAVLFHQFGGSRADWTDMGRWLQNREISGGIGAGWLALPLRQYAWFPAMPPERTMNVLAIDFRSHGESGSGSGGMDTAGFLMDAQAALAYARALPSVDSQRIITMGASIGADASVDACAVIEAGVLANLQQNQGCVAAVSLSPGNFLEVDYVDVVSRLGADPFDMKIHCIATEQDGASPALCQAQAGDHYSGTVYTGRGEHGTAMLQPGFDPDIGQVIFDFLMEAIDR